MCSNADIVTANTSKANVVSFSLNCPGNVYASCTDELWDLSIYGNATYTLNYYTYSAGTPVVTYNLNSCNAGTITRTWTVEDNYWNLQSCTQTIYVSTSGSGGPDITWPEDVELEGCNPDTNPYHMESPYNYPTWTSSECSMLGKSYSDMLFTVNSQCKKIMRTWKVIDWCSFNGGSGYGTYTKVQIIKIINNTPPDVVCPAEYTFNAFNCKNAIAIIPPLVIDPSICGGDFEITNNSAYATSKGNNISGTYPIGTTKVTYTVKYGCGKIKTCSTNVVVKNANKPTPYCIGSLITALMGIDTDGDGAVDNGMVELWAKDLDKGSKSACGYGPLKFSFSKDVTETNRTFTCEDIGKNNVEMWVTDSKGAQSYCIVEITVQNNGANIPDCHPKPVEPEKPIYTVVGNVATPTDVPVRNAVITLSYNDSIVTYTTVIDTSVTLQLDSFINASGYKLYRYKNVTTITQHIDSTVTGIATLVTNTDSLGKYLFDSLSVIDKPISISASYADAAHNGIDNKDVELLTKFLLGEVTFSSYHQYLASDIDENGKVNADDLNALMKFVLLEVDSLPGSNQWYLLDAAASFGAADDVLSVDLPYVIVLDSVAKEDNIANFVAIKKGNISIDDNNLEQQSVESRTKALSSTAIKVYPNPFTDVISMDIDSDVDDTANIYLFDSKGQQLNTYKKSVFMGQNTFTLPIHNDVYGLIFYQVRCGSKSYSGMLARIH